MLHYTSRGVDGCSENGTDTPIHAGLTVMRKKKPRIRIEKEARRRARAGIGMPPPERLIADKRHKPPKHKKSLLDSGRA